MHVSYASGNLVSTYSAANKPALKPNTAQTHKPPVELKFQGPAASGAATVGGVAVLASAIPVLARAIPHLGDAFSPVADHFAAMANAGSFGSGVGEFFKGVGSTLWSPVKAAYGPTTSEAFYQALGSGSATGGGGWLTLRGATGLFKKAGKAAGS